MKQILIILLCVSEIKNQNMSLFMHDYSFEPKISKIFYKLLLKYKNFEIIFHTENRTAQYVEIVMNYFRYKSNYKEIYLTSYLVYNHDKLSSGQIFERPHVSRIVNFLFTKRWKLWKKLAVPKKINSNDVVMFVAIGNGTVLETVNKKGMEFVKLAGKTLLIEIVPHHGVLFYDTCYYCGDQSMKYRFIEKTHNSYLHSAHERFLPDNFKNLNGHKFIITFIPYFPYIICNNSTTKKNKTICYDIQGIESKMLKTISSKMNFSFQVEIMPNEATFFNMVQFVSNCNADLAIGGISMTEERVPLVQFTNQYNSEEFTFLYLFSINIKEVFIKFIEPFNAVTVWILYITSMFLISFLLFIAVRITHRKSKHISYSDCTFIIFRGCLEQSNPKISFVYRRRSTIAFTLGMWWWICLITNTVYRSTVLSTVVNPPSLEPDDMSELLQSGYKIVANQQFADIVKDLLLVNDSLYTEALKKIGYGQDTCDVFQSILRDQTAMLDETSTIQFEIRATCKLPTHDVSKWLRIGRKGLRSTGHAWALQRGAPFRAAIDYYVNLIISGGLFKKWTNDVTSLYKKKMIPKSREAINKRFRSLSLKRFYPLLSVYLICITISVVIFLFEVVYYNIIHYKYTN